MSDHSYKITWFGHSVTFYRKNDYTELISVSKVFSSFDQSLVHVLKTIYNASIFFIINIYLYLLFQMS